MSLRGIAGMEIDLDDQSSDDAVTNFHFDSRPQTPKILLTSSGSTSAVRATASSFKALGQPVPTLTASQSSESMRTISVAATEAETASVTTTTTTRPQRQASLIHSATLLPSTTTQSRPATQSASRKNAIKTIDGYPLPSKTQIPPGLTLKQICEQFPNHLIGEDLNQFIDAMSSKEIWEAMPAEKDQLEVSSVNKWNYIQKRMARQRQILNSQGILAQVTANNIARHNREVAADRGVTQAAVVPQEPSTNREFPISPTALPVPTKLNPFLRPSNTYAALAAPRSPNSYQPSAIQHPNPPRLSLRPVPAAATATQPASNQAVPTLRTRLRLPLLPPVPQSEPSTSHQRARQQPPSRRIAPSQSRLSLPASLDVPPSLVPMASSLRQTIEDQLRLLVNILLHDPRTGNRSRAVLRTRAIEMWSRRVIRAEIEQQQHNALSLRRDLGPETSGLARVALDVYIGRLRRVVERKWDGDERRDVGQEMQDSLDGWTGEWTSLFLDYLHRWNLPQRIRLREVWMQWYGDGVVEGESDVEFTEEEIAAREPVDSHRPPYTDAWPLDLVTGYYEAGQ